MSTCVRLAAVLMLLATPALAQTTTEDGIRALLRGDSQGATRILRPLADDPARPDPVAQFFLGLVYDAGGGEASMRACSLFLRSAIPANPLMAQAAALAALLRDEFGGAAPLICVAEERWQGGPPQAFVLEPGHRVVFADTSITVTDGDREQRAVILLPPGVTVLPIQYTPLAVTRPAAARRHFFQWFMCRPDTTVNPASWTVSWTLSEIIGDRWMGVASETRLAVAAGATCPDVSTVAALVRLGVNASGEAEFTVRGGDSPRTEVIPSRGIR
jgi:hypothetical protein